MKGGMSRLFALLAAVALLTASVPGATRAQTTMLYDGAVANQTPADQGYFSYQTSPSPPATATFSYASGGTLLKTLGANGDDSAVFASSSRLPALSRTQGYTLTFTAQVRSEVHESSDRAGFSILVLGNDRQGIELAFWEDEVWAQNDSVNDPTAGRPLFSHGEGAAFNTTARPVTYTLSIKDRRYRLLANGAELLAGPLRAYSTQIDPAAPGNRLRLVYFLTNALFLGDNTSAAGVEVLLTRIALETVSAPPPPPPTQTPRAYLPLVAR